jgi:hypothetical protein
MNILQRYMNTESYKIRLLLIVAKPKKIDELLRLLDQNGYALSLEEAQETFDPKAVEVTNIYDAIQYRYNN